MFPETTWAARLTGGGGGVVSGPRMIASAVGGSGDRQRSR